MTCANNCGKRCGARLATYMHCLALWPISQTDQGTLTEPLPLATFENDRGVERLMEKAFAQCWQVVVYAVVFF